MYKGGVVGTCDLQRYSQSRRTACCHTEQPLEVIPASSSHWQPMDNFLFHRNYTRQTSGTAMNREAAGFVNSAVNEHSLCESEIRNGKTIHSVIFDKFERNSQIKFFMASGDPEITWKKFTCLENDGCDYCRPLRCQSIYCVRVCQLEEKVSSISAV